MILKCEVKFMIWDGHPLLRVNRNRVTGVIARIYSGLTGKNWNRKNRSFSKGTARKIETGKNGENSNNIILKI